MKIKYTYRVFLVIFSVAMALHCNLSKAIEGEVSETQQKKLMYSIIREAASYPVTDVAACISGVKSAASVYADLIRQGALDSEEYTRFSIENQIKFAFENGTPFDIYSFKIIFNLLRIIDTPWEEISKNNGVNYANQTAFYELITCKFNSGISTKLPTGQIPKETILKMIDSMPKE